MSFVLTAVPRRAIEPFASAWRLRHLAWRLARRDIVARYRGSMLGPLWTLLPSVLMVVIYTFGFGVVFKAKWPGASESPLDYALFLFAGMMVFGFVSETAQRAPGLIMRNPNFVTKVAFPLDALVIAEVMVSAFYLGVNAMVFVLAAVVLGWTPTLSWLWSPIVLLPMLFGAGALVYVLAALGVYLRDIGQSIGLVFSALIFLSPVFYPLDAVPEAVRPLIHLNPLTWQIDSFRRVTLYGEMPDWRAWAVALGVAVLAYVLAYHLFQKARRGFADVL
jgi:lipopolysaccharide transport system permease protein